MLTGPVQTRIRYIGNSVAFGVLAAWMALTVASPGSLHARQAPENRSRRFGPDACGPVDPTYLRMANETGGQPMFLQPSEIAKGGLLMSEVTGNNRETVFWATGRLGEGSGEFVVPVDSSMKRVTFALSVDTKGSSMAVVHPSGAEVQQGNFGTEISDLNCGRIATVAPPEPGEWRIRLSGSGRFWVQATAQTGIYFVGVDFVKLGGRPGHEGLFRIAGQPLAGQPATLQAQISGPAKTAEFKLVTERGETIQSINMRAEDSSGDSREYTGTLDLPATPFRIAVTGLDSRGNAYQRFYHSLFHAEYVEIAPERNFEDIPLGKTTPVAFTVRNLGTAATFRIIAVDAKRFMASAESQEISLAKGEKKTVIVEMSVPQDTQVGAGDDLTITATSTSGQPTSNGTSVRLSVVK